MRIGILWHCAYPWDIRIEKMARTFIAARHEVVIIAKGGPDVPRRETRDGIRISRIYLPLAPRRMAKLLSLPLFFNPFWFLAAYRAVRGEHLDVLMVRDLPLAWPAAMMGKLLGIPVVFDMAENYPAALLSYQRKLYQPFLIGNAMLPRAYERLSLRCVDRVLVVAEEQQQRLERSGVAPARIELVRNTPDCGYLQRLSGPGLGHGTATRPYILYSGFIDHHRGIATLLLAFNEIKERYRDLRLMLIGDGKALPSLKRLAERLAIVDRVVFTGWLDFALVPAYIRDSTLCVIPHLRTEHTETTLPNKIFDYLYFNKPVIVSDAAPLARMVKEAGGGLVFRSGDPHDLAGAITRALTGGAGEVRGRAIIEHKYNWENDAQTLLRTVAAGGRR